MIAAENAWLSPLPPEGASAIVHGDLDHAAEMAEAQRVGAIDLFENGTVHHLVARAGGRHARGSWPARSPPRSEPSSWR